MKDSSLLNGPGLLAPKGQDDLIALRKVLISTIFKVLAKEFDKKYNISLIRKVLMSIIFKVLASI